jgi:hypothetical protein
MHVENEQSRVVAEFQQKLPGHGYPIRAHVLPADKVNTIIHLSPEAL